jgi:CMP-N-acetylneuraminic acid synthetase
MKEFKGILAHIPARAGSQRLKSKNLRMLRGKPMIAYAIENALNSACFDEIYVNTDCDKISTLATQYGVKVYKRAPELASDSASGDDFTYDFINKIKPNLLVMISPVCPLIEPIDIKNAISIFKSSPGTDTLIATSKTQLQTFLEDKPVNIEIDTPLEPTQNNPTVFICNWAITIWDAKIFLERYRKFGYAYLGDKRILYPIDYTKSIKISTEEDFQQAELILASRELCGSKKVKVEYWQPS